MEKRKEKAKESIQAVLPILFIVLLLSFTVAPVSASILLEFMIGAVFVIIGMLFFSMGAEMSLVFLPEFDLIFDLLVDL